MPAAVQPGLGTDVGGFADMQQRQQRGPGVDGASTDVQHMRTWILHPDESDCSMLAVPERGVRGW